MTNKVKQLKRSMAFIVLIEKNLFQ